MRADIFIYITSPSFSPFIYACTRVSSHVTEHSPFFSVLYNISLSELRELVMHNNNVSQLQVIYTLLRKPNYMFCLYVNHHQAL